ncbi:peptidoglycan DD-metalloendopeptidase family protein [Methylobacillus flagellatus]|uniref:peptidoglycan DD-metalloendopeptidase family protein n=1 Tax=Methylobacillus flagellatus TaxID=405 RepID=UPI0014852041|nr:peptidoglycan DD-metalloendopeptidase family protein [Methylobacillus flagellatus]
MKTPHHLYLACVTLLLAACASNPPAPVIERLPASKPAPPASAVSKPATAKPAPREGLPDVHVVKKGDTLYSIGLEYGQDYRDVARVNNLTPPYALRIGQQLNLQALRGTEMRSTENGDEAVTSAVQIAAPPTATTGTPIASPLPASTTPAPGTAPVIGYPKALREPYSLQALNTPPETKAPASAATASASAKPATTALPGSPDSKPVEAKPADTTSIASPPAVASESGPDAVNWAWPAKGKLIAGYNDTSSAKGIDIAGSQGQAVLAAAAGKVIYSGADLRGYGKLVIIKHNATYLSVYAHNSNILVKEGQQVSQGQKIAEMGSTDTDRVKLHFEIRRQGKSIDPAPLLPAQ